MKQSALLLSALLAPTLVNAADENGALAMCKEYKNHVSRAVSLSRKSQPFEDWQWVHLLYYFGQAHQRRAELAERYPKAPADEQRQIDPLREAAEKGFKSLIKWIEDTYGQLKEIQPKEIQPVPPRTGATPIFGDPGIKSGGFLQFKTILVGELRGTTYAGGSIDYEIRIPGSNDWTATDPYLVHLSLSQLTGKEIDPFDPRDVEKVKSEYQALLEELAKHPESDIENLASQHSVGEWTAFSKALRLGGQADRSRILGRVASHEFEKRFDRLDTVLSSSRAGSLVAPDALAQDFWVYDLNSSRANTAEGILKNADDGFFPTGAHILAPGLLGKGSFRIKGKTSERKMSYIVIPSGSPLSTNIYDGKLLVRPKGEVFQSVAEIRARAAPGMGEYFETME